MPLHTHSATAEPATAGQHQEVKLNKAVESAPLTGTGTVLLVEDEELVLFAVKMMLEAMGYTVLPADRPEKAIALCEQDEAFDLILTDVVMPGMNGREMVERISGIKPGTKVLFMSGYTADFVAWQGVVEEGRHFIAKPFDMKHLHNKIQQVRALPAARAI